MTSRRILAAALPLALAVVVLGAFTRLSDAGLGCPDWPACYGQLVGIPDAETARLRHPESPLDPQKARIEIAHRYAAALLGLAVLAALVAAFRRPENEKSEKKIVLGLAVLVLAQAALGAFTVTEKLQPAIVVAHLLGGMSILFLLALAAPTPPGLQGPEPKKFRSGPEPKNSGSGPEPKKFGPGLKKFGVVAVLILGLQIALGGWVSANHAGVACGTQFPKCQNQFVPPDFTLAGFAPGRRLGLDSGGGPVGQNQLASIHFVHRTFAWVALLALGALAWKIGRAGRVRAAGILLGLLVLQFLLGISSAVFNLPFWAALGHNAVAALLAAHLAFSLRPHFFQPASPS